VATDEDTFVQGDHLRYEPAWRPRRSPGASARAPSRGSGRRRS